MLSKSYAFDTGNRIEKFSSRQIDVDLDLYYCGLENCPAHFHYGPYARTDYLIHCIVKGRGYYEFNGNRYELSQGDIFTIFPGDITYYASYPEDPWSFCWVGFNGKKAAEYLKKGGITRNAPVTSILPQHAFDDLIETCAYALTEDTAPIKTKLQSYLYLLFSRLQENYAHTKKSPQPIEKSAGYIQQALLFIEYNYFKPISVQTISNYVALERTYFSRIFTRATGLSAQQYLIQYRIEKAVNLMETTNLNIKQIGISVGIPDQNYFSRLFKKIKGINPTEYKKMHS